MSYEDAVKASFDASKKHPEAAKYGAPFQVYDAPGDPMVGSSVSIEQANPLLAPYNMLLREVRLWGELRYVLSVLDGDKPWPSNWGSVADDIVMGGEERPNGRYGRKKWPVAS